MKIYQVDQLKQLQEKLNNMNPVDIAEQFDVLTGYEIGLRIKLLKKDLLADTFALLSKEKKQTMIELLTEAGTRNLIKELDEDELVDTLQELPANMVSQFMKQFVDPARRPVINELLGYPEESVGSIMSVNFLAVHNDLTVAQVLQRVKASELDAIKLELIWVIDPTFSLLGFVYLADLIRGEDQPLQDHLRPLTQTVFACDDQEIVAKLALRYDLSEIPVVDSEQRLVGTVPVEWAIDVLADEYEEDMANISGINDEEDTPYLQQSSLKIAKSRISWLLICLITASITGLIMKRYEASLASSVALAVYIPMLMDSGGNAGSQSSTTLIRALYGGQLDAKAIFQVILKEMEIGFYVGLIMGVINMLRILLIDHVSFEVNLVVSLTLVLTVMISKVMGGILPLIADKLKIDPTVMAGPLITTIVDTISLVVYFEVGNWILGL